MWSRHNFLFFFLVCIHSSVVVVASAPTRTSTYTRTQPFTMGVDYTARKAAKKARKAEGRTSVGKRNERSNRRGGDRGAVDGDDKKSKRDRPKYGRKGARRMCKGMCYGAAPLVSWCGEGR